VGSRYIIDIKLAVSLQKQKSTYTPAGVHLNYVGQCKVLQEIGQEEDASQDTSSSLAEWGSLMDTSGKTLLL
jgi:hypothetical protein